MHEFAQRQPQPARQASVDRPRSRPAVSAPPDRVHPLVQLQRLVGNQAVQRLLGPEPGDRSLAGVVPSIVEEVVASPGLPLDLATRALMEPRFGHNFARVRVHTDARAAESAAAVNARAYTVGSHVVLGAGQPSPETSAGRQLLAHELAHVVQQHGGSSRPAPEISPSAPHERDAHSAAMAVVAGRPQAHVTTSTGVGLAGTWEEAEEVAIVAGDFLLERGYELSLHPLSRERSLVEIEDKLRTLAASSGPNAAQARELLAELDRALEGLPARSRQLQETLRGARDFLNRHGRGWGGGGGRGRRITTIKTELQGLAGSDAEAKRLLEQLERVQGEVRELEAAARQAAARPTAYKSGTTAATQAGKDVPTKAGQTAAKLETEGAGAVRGVTTPTATAASGAKVESAIVSEVKATTRIGSGVAKAGFRGVKNLVGGILMMDPLLLPGPWDALMLMVQVCGSYGEAWEAIKSRNTRDGFAFGLSGSLLGRSFGTVGKNFGRTSAEVNVSTVFEASVGMAENAYNAGLRSGFQYGELLSDDASDALRKVGFAALDAKGRLPATWNEMLTADGMRRLGVALLPSVDQIFEAMRAQAEKEREAEKRQRYLESGSMRGMKQ
jgi:hypothetical protein